MNGETDQTKHRDQVSASAEPVLEIFRSIADTTWRMVVPPAFFVVAGLYLDIHSAAKPWFTLTGLVMGLMVGALLVRRQLRGIK